MFSYIINVHGESALKQVPDEILALRVKEGDVQCFEELYQRYRSSLFGYLLNMVRDYDLAEDFFQETFCRALAKINTFNGSNFQVWLYAIARHLVIDHWKKVRVRSRHPLIVIENDAIKDTPWSNPHRRIVDAEVLEKVSEAIDRLSPKLREPLIMYAVLGMDYDEIARLTGVNTKTLKVRVFRARMKLLEMLEGML